MYPAGRYIGQRNKDEGAVVRTRMRQNGVGMLAHHPVDGDNVQIQCAGGIWRAACPPGGVFDALQPP